MNKLSAYNSFFSEIIDTINSARYKAYKSLNKFHIGQNFEIGRIIIENQDKNQWGQSIVDTLSKDINKQIDGVKGYSPQNLWRMRQFYLEYKDEPELLEMAMKIPWGQNMLIIQQLKDNKERKYYLKATDQLAWSRAVLLNQIKANAYQYHLTHKKLSNFEKALPIHLSEQANEALKSEYNLDFLGITKPILEKELENRLIENIRDLLLELGYGFSFIGNQYRLKLNQKEYFIDLLFYHRILKCLIAIELKTVEFEPEFAGKMNFYLELLDEQERQLDDNPSIGIILCPIKDNLEVEYALRTSDKPIGVSEYKLTHKLPEKFKGKVPSSKELKQMLTKAMRNAGLSDNLNDDTSNEI
jgi:predicted nuclease of restriction endonuclease-like (RecB) superfamily